MFDMLSLVFLQFSVKLSLKEDFDVKKFSIVKNKVSVNGHTYVESDVYYDGELLDFDREALNPSGDDISIIEVETANAALSNANSLEGEVVCVSGKFEGHTQEEMETLVANSGATVSSSVTKKTTMLVTGDKVGATKLTKAQELGIKIVPQEEFFKMVGGVQTSVSNKNISGEAVDYSILSKSIKLAFNDDDTCSVNGYNGKQSDVVIPSKVINKGKTYSVTSIGYEAFYECKKLSSIVIPDSVTSIGANAFYGCEKLSSIVIPEGVTSIGEYAFDECKNLSSIVIPDSVTSIGGSAFSNCEKLSSIVIPDSVIYIGKSAFLKCEKLSSIVIPDRVTSIGESAFENCENLSSIVIPDSVTSIGNNAFSVCKNLSSIVIPDSVTSIGKRAFAYCENLKEITIPKHKINLGDDVFDGCEALDEKIKDAFYEACNDQTGDFELAFNDDDTCSINGYNGKKSDIVIPSKVINEGKTYSVTSIGNNAFSFFEKLSSIVIPDSVTSIGESAFYKCKKLSSIVIPDSVTSIGERAFACCKNLKEITIPKHGIDLGGDVFDGCEALDEKIKDAFYEACKK